MSIEKTIENHTKALLVLNGTLERIAEALTGTPVFTRAFGEEAVVSAPEGKEIAVVNAAADIEAPTEPEEKAAALAPVKAPAKQADASPPAHEPDLVLAPTLQQVSDATRSAATKNHAGVVALLKKYGVKKAGQIQQDKWAAYIAEVEAL